MIDVDLVMFMGQSNMAGRGTAADAPDVPSGFGYEFRAISDPTRLYPIKEPFGINENNAISGVTESIKTGSMISSFVIGYYKITQRPIVGVSCSKGGTSINLWQPKGAFLNDAIARFNAANNWLTANGYTIKNKFMVWCQGETDGDNAMSEGEYTIKLKTMVDGMIEAGLESCYIVQIGNHRDHTTLYAPIIQAQTAFCNTYEKAVLVSTKFSGMAAAGLMKDPFHYTQAGYNITGTDAGNNTAVHITTRNIENAP
ncbi:hypothetical protein PAT3040_06625 [Paenibacillus agaridevorans]|uniref:Sialate O-acetylesterase domain-containing protein n=1 Tax=Paenibacillus agaridevorans TaxID=171404 RepID=A0A2R5F2G7_9BACL|nr:sialate O-acetylesterase [Paenibacillus agaridevorans]GBG11778.1 hypothetical protein PAT3040_06625 [Paenibacillus agaridevorans]